MQLPEIFNRFRDDIDAELKSVLSPYPAPLYDMMRYHLGWIDERGNRAADASGKALRPTLCLLASEAVNSDYTRALPAAAAVELVHNYSLIHDDIQDDDAERRHRPTVWKIWGKPQAINAGTAMRILANRALDRAAERALPDPVRRRMQEAVDEATLRLIEGQFMDIDFENRFDIGEGDYLAMIRGKTAALISCALELGALTGAGDEPTINSFRDFGENMGIAFQVRDDILGIWGDPEKTGKARGNDIRRKKKSLPVVTALSQGTETQRDEIRRIFGKDSVSDGDVDRVLGIMDEVGARAGVQGMVDEYCDRAGRSIAGAAIDPGARKDFDRILEFLCVRNY